MAGSFLNSQYREVRPARAESLSDGRKRLTRFVTFKQNSEFPAEMGGVVATTTDAATNWASPPTGWENLYLISAVTDTSLSPNGSGNNPVTILTFESAGTIAQTDETKNNGALLIRTIRTAHTAPSTPAGYTLIQTVDDNPSGFDTFTYTFAKGDGQISRVDETRNNGALLVATITHLTAPGAADPVATLSGYTRVSISNQESDGHEVWRAVFMQGSGEIGRDESYAQSVTAGSSGVTRTTIRYIVPDEGTVMPTSLAGYVLVGKDYVDQDGYRIWTTTWGKGTGTVVTSTEIKNGGALYIYRKVALGSAPTAPTASTGGTVTEIGSSERQDSGYTIYEKTWAEGEGEISRNIDYRLSGDTGTNGITVTTIRHLTASSVGTDPTDAPAGSVKISEDKADQDGYRVWTVVYAKGTGEVSRSISYRQSVDAGTTGLTFWTIRHLTAISVGTDPTSNPGSAIKTGEDHVDQDGYRVWTVNWAKGTGVVTTDVSGRSDGSIAYIYTTLSATSSTPSYTGGGTAYLTDLTNTLADGYYVNRAVYILPPATDTYKKMRQVRMPGEVEFETATGGHNLLVTSESNRLLKCDVEVSYATTQLTDTPWKVNYGTTYRASYKRTGQTVYEYEQKVMPFFLASSDSVSGTTGDFYNGVECEAYAASITASSPTALPTGATVLDVDHEPYLVATDGTVVYRRTKVSYTF